MRAVSLAVLWFSLLALSVVWFLGQATYRQKNQDFFEVALSVRFAANEEVRKEATRKFDSFNTAGAEGLAYRNWRELSVLMFGVVVCAALWVSIAPTGPAASQRRMCRLAFQGSMAGAWLLGAGSAIAFCLLDGTAALEPGYD
jgi:hypothetical protein